MASSIGSVDRPVFHRDTGTAGELSVPLPLWLDEHPGHLLLPPWNNATGHAAIILARRGLSTTD